jgi:uncharacterized protein YqjF (DUF2071 family)
VTARQPENRVLVPMMRQQWRDMTFLHWPLAPDLVAPHLPPGLEVDTFEERAWVGLTAFRVAACAPGLLPSVPRWSFPETNLRTYVVGPDGRDGIWFLSIEADTVAVSTGARLALGAPYHVADMSVSTEGSAVRYRSHRRDDTAAHDVRICAGPALADSERSGLVDWLTGRWRSWTTRAGLLLRSAVEHQPWPLCGGEVVAVEETVSTAVGLRLPDVEPLVHFSRGVDARLGAPVPRIARGHASNA